MPAADDTTTDSPGADATLADFVAAFREGMQPMGGAEPSASLPPPVVALLARCARDFERESQRLIQRRRHVGAMVFSATFEEENCVRDYFVSTLNLRVVEIDARTIDQLSDEQVEGRLKTLAEPTAHIVAIRGLGNATDPRVLSAIEWADVDVLVVGFAEADTVFSPAVRRCARQRVDVLRPTSTSGMLAFSLFR